MDESLNSESVSTRMFMSHNVTESTTSQSGISTPGSQINETSNEGFVLIDAERQRIIVIAVLMALTLIGNMTLILVLLCKRSRRIKRVNILLLNLAFGDLAVAMFVNSTEILFVAFGDWALGPIVCKISVYVQMICLSSATNLLTAMSIDRYQVIVKPMQSLARRPRIWLKIAIAWTLSLIFPIPQLFIFVQYDNGFKYDGTPKRICGSRGYTASWQRKVYFTYTTIYILVVPMVIMLYCYTKIIRVVWIRAKKETRKRPGCLTHSALDRSSNSSTPPKNSSDNAKEICSSTENSEIGCGCEGGAKVKMSSKNPKSVRWARNINDSKVVNESASETDRKFRVQGQTEEDFNAGSPRMSVRRSLVTASKRRVLVMTLTVVISFLVCHTPYFVVTLVRIYSDYQMKLEKVMFVSEFLVMVHSTLNPLLYGLFTLRQYHLKYIFSLLTCTPHPQGHRLRQYSQERNKLFTNVRSKLGNISNSNTTTTTFMNSCNSTHTDPLLGRKKGTVTGQSPFKNASAAASSSSTNILARFRSKSKPNFTRKLIQHSQTSILFANSDAISLTQQHRDTSKNPDVGSQSSISTSSDLIPQCTFIANSHLLKNNGSVSPSINSYKREVSLGCNGGSDVKTRLRFPDVDCELIRNVNAFPLSTVDDDKKVGSSTRV